MISISGKPYDTLEEVIGIRPSNGSLAEYGITYKQVELKEDGSFDWEEIRSAITPKTKLVEIQRSKGYLPRPTLSVEAIGEAIAFVKSIRRDIICMVDNCYGEFVERIEPSDLGADMVVGSLIKNPGGGLAPIGGYIAGTNAVCGKCRLPPDVSGAWKGSGCFSGCNAFLLSGIFYGSDCDGRSAQGSNFCSKYL